MEVLMEFAGNKEFIESFREAAKVLIVQRGQNKDGQYLVAAVYGVGERRGLLLIPEGHGGW
jgi:hypothetical protein